MSKWKNIEKEDDLNTIIEKSKEKPVAIFKHSTSCSISAMALNRLQREWKDEEMENLDFYYLDLLSYRSLSNKIAEKLNVDHQSPQIIIVKDGKAVYHNSHMGVSYSELKKNI